VADEPGIRTPFTVQPSAHGSAGNSEAELLHDLLLRAWY
jgi:hypothetical protein